MHATLLGVLQTRLQSYRRRTRNQHLYTESSKALGEVRTILSQERDHRLSVINAGAIQWQTDSMSERSPDMDGIKLSFDHLFSPMIRNLLIFLCTWCAVVCAGCSKKQVRTVSPVSLEKLENKKKPPSVEETWREMGVRLAKEKKYQAAVDAFQNYVLEQPEDYFGFNALAVCYKNMGDLPGAMKNYDRALELATVSEEKAKILANIGNLYFAADKPQSALDMYKEAFSEFSKNPLYLIFIARTWVALDEYDRARKVLRQAEEMESRLSSYEREEDRGLGSYLMAYSYLALNEEDKVFKYLKKALEANPKRFVQRIKRDLADEKSLLFTLRDNSELNDALKQYSLATFFESIFKH